MPTLPVEILHQLLRYDALTGLLYWKDRDESEWSEKMGCSIGEIRRWNARHAGKVALTSRTRKGYPSGCILSVSVKAHSVVWAMHQGEWPQGIIDHKNGNPADNRIENLRLATASQNAQNMKRHKDGATGFKGVIRSGRKWVAQITCKRKHFYLGTFVTPEAAARAYDSAAIRLHGEFAATNETLGLLKGVTA